MDAATQNRPPSHGEVRTHRVPTEQPDAPIPQQLIEPTTGPRIDDLPTLSSTIDAVINGLPHLVSTCSDSELVAVISKLEQLKNACSAGQARATMALKEIRLSDATTQREREDAHRSTVSEIALARKESPHRAKILLGLATALTQEMPETMSHLDSGRISEWRAALVARETACLDLEDRRTVDRELSTDLPNCSNREIVTRAKKQAYSLDPESVVARVGRAVEERRVTIRPAPDCMTVVTALLPVAQGVGVHAALLRAAESARAAGDPRGKGQVMADTLVTRVTGQTSADAVPLEVQVVISDDALLGHADTAARVAGYGPLPAGVARALISRTGSSRCRDPESEDGSVVSPICPDRDPDLEARHWIRRLYTRPEDGQLVAMESTRRIFPPALRRFVAARDANTCRTPWCDAPIAHIDHVIPVRVGGPTMVANAQGLCIHCNQAKEAPGWNAHPDDDGEVTLTTPTGATYTTRPPPLPQGPDRARGRPSNRNKSPAA